jgi:hypothetical protein
MIEVAPGERIVVIGGDYRQAMNWARWESGLHTDQVVLVRRAADLLGLPRGLRYVLVGLCWERADWPEISGQLRAREARQITG